MKTLIQNKNTLAIIAFFILAMFIYNFFFKSDVISPTTETEASIIGDDLIKIHNDLQAVTLSREVFTSAAYLYLTDFSTAIPQQAVGRSNPFNNIGRD